MEQKEYTIKRNELIDIFSQIISKSQENSKLEKKYLPSLVENIEKKKNKLSENQFKMVLCGAFQGGKSTTFNAICDGRELSPTGFGIKTSACLIEAHYLSDPNAEEYAKIYLRSPVDIFKGFEKEFKSTIIRKDEEERTNIIKEDRPLSSYFNVFEEKYLNLLSKVVDDEITYYKDPDFDYPSSTIDILKYAKIVVDAIKSGAVTKEWIETKVYECTLDEVRNALKFPEDFSSRWENGTFSFEEIKWAFINKVELHIKGVSQMADFGFVLVDAPGLFVSDWDSELTLNAIRDSDAVLFIVEGDKEIDQATIKVIKEIKKGAEKKEIFLCFNRRNTIEYTPAIIKSSIAKLHEVSSDFKEENYTTFHARLSLNLNLYKLRDDIKIIKEIANDASNCFDIEVEKTKEAIWEKEDFLKEKASLDELISKGKSFIARNRGAKVLNDAAEIIKKELKEAQDTEINTILKTKKQEREAKKKELEEECKRFDNYKTTKDNILTNEFHLFKDLQKELKDLFYNSLKSKLENFLDPKKNLKCFEEHINDKNIHREIFSVQLYSFLKENYGGFKIIDDLSEQLQKGISDIFTDKISKEFKSTISLPDVKKIINKHQEKLFHTLKEKLKTEQIFLIDINELYLEEEKYELLISEEVSIKLADKTWGFFKGTIPALIKAILLVINPDEIKRQKITELIFQKDILKSLKEDIWKSLEDVCELNADAYIEQLLTLLKEYADKKDKEFYKKIESLRKDLNQSEKSFVELQNETKEFSENFIKPAIAKLDDFTKSLN